MTTTDRSTNYRIIGTRPVRPDGVEKVTQTIFWERSVSLFTLNFGRADGESAGAESADGESADRRGEDADPGAARHEYRDRQGADRIAPPPRTSPPGLGPHRHRQQLPSPAGAVLPDGRLDGGPSWGAQAPLGGEGLARGGAARRSAPWRG